MSEIVLHSQVLTESGPKYTECGSYDSKNFFANLVYKTHSQRLGKDVICAKVCPLLQSGILESIQEYEIGLETIDTKDELISRYKGKPNYNEIVQKYSKRDLTVTRANLSFEEGYKKIKPSIGTVQTLESGQTLTTEFVCRLSTGRMLALSQDDFENKSVQEIESEDTNGKILKIQEKNKL